MCSAYWRYEVVHGEQGRGHSSRGEGRLLEQRERSARPNPTKALTPKQLKAADVYFVDACSQKETAKAAGALPRPDQEGPGRHRREARGEGRHDRPRDRTVLHEVGPLTGGGMKRKRAEGTGSEGHLHRTIRYRIREIRSQRLVRRLSEQARWGFLPARRGPRACCVALLIGMIPTRLGVAASSWPQSGRPAR